MSTKAAARSIIEAIAAKHITDLREAIEEGEVDPTTPEEYLPNMKRAAKYPLRRLEDLKCNRIREIRERGNFMGSYPSLFPAVEEHHEHDVCRAATWLTHHEDATGRAVARCIWQGATEDEFEPVPLDFIKEPEDVDPEGVELGFGQHRGESVASLWATERDYLEWILSTDIIIKHPEISAAIRACAGLEVKFSETVKGECFDLPSDLSYTVRGGGRMRDGVSSFERAFDEHGTLKWAYVESDDHRSGSGKSGRVEWKRPEEDGLYRIDITGGSIANHSTTTHYVVLQGGEWYEIAGKDQHAVVLGGARVEAS